MRVGGASFWTQENVLYPMIFLWIHPQISHQTQLKIPKSILFLLDIKKQILNS